MQLPTRRKTRRRLLPKCLNASPMPVLTASGLHQEKGDGKSIEYDPGDKEPQKQPQYP